MSRREFLQTSTLGAAATSMAGFSHAEEKANDASLDGAYVDRKGVRWPIGCLNRPWVKEGWSYDVALDGIKAAGYKWTGLLTRTKSEPFTGSDATSEYLAELKKKIAARDLKVNMSAIRTKNDLPLAEQIKDVRQQIDNGKFVGVATMLTFGVDKAEHFENYYRLMGDAAAYADEHKIKLVLKPHGGASGASEEILRCMEKVKHPNFKIWFDAGNIIFYTGKDPLEQLKPIAQHVTGFCAKDCGAPKGNVFIQFGAGKVDFPAVFGELKRAGFNGPVMVECCEQGATPEIVSANAAKNREFLEKLFASL